MNLFEMWFGISPDAGTGATEILYGLGAIVGLSLLLGQRRRSKFIRSRHRR
jgi:hypothetical protein